MYYKLKVRDKILYLIFAVISLIVTFAILGISLYSIKIGGIF